MYKTGTHLRLGVARHELGGVPDVDRAVPHASGDEAVRVLGLLGGHLGPRQRRETGAEQARTKQHHRTDVTTQHEDSRTKRGPAGEARHGTGRLSTGGFTRQVSKLYGKRHKDCSPLRLGGQSFTWVVA